MTAASFREISAQFAQPASPYRGAPFWSWNGDLEPEELRRQIRQMKQAGLGGFFMHARVGLATDYLSERWFECVRACVDEARTLGMKAYLYDEDRWPSGAAGGLVTADHRFAMRTLAAVEYSDPAQVKVATPPVAIYQADIDGEFARNVERLDRIPAVLAKGKTLVVFEERVLADSPWFNDQTYLDTLNPQAVKRFIDVTYEAYAREIGACFGNVSPAIFTDEPNFGVVCRVEEDGAVSRPWTPGFAGLFRERFGYDIADKLMEIFYRVEERDMPLAQLHYMEEITTLFVNSFGRQVGEWCGAHGIDFTGHLLCEDTLSSQSMMVGNCMRFYEHMQLPGMDQLSEFWQIFDTVKQLASAARQFGRTWRLSETYGCTGWHFPFAGHKAVGDWQCVLGVNLRCQHLAWYTMAGEAKRDYPAAISRQSPWFEFYSTVEDYFGRVNVVNSVGSEVRDILVIHPIESMWLLMNGNVTDSKRVKEFDAAFADCRNALMRANLDFDYGDEDIIARHAAIEVRDGVAILKLGAAEYRQVALPPLITMRKSTLDLLRRFHAAGGVIVAADRKRLATRFDGVAEAGCAGELADLVAAGDWLELLGRDARLRIRDGQGRAAEAVLYQLRERADGLSLMVCNTGFVEPVGADMLVMTRALERTRAYPVLNLEVAHADGEGEWLELDPVDGSMYRARAEFLGGGRWRIATQLAPLESRLFVLAPVGSVAPLAERPERTVRKTTPLTPEGWEFELEEPNVAVFDLCRWRFAGEEAWRDEDFILHIDDLVREKAGVRPRGGAMVQPWARQAEAFQPVTVELEFGFDCEAVPQTPVWWAMEEPRAATVRVNGIALTAAADAGFWVDESVKKLPIPAGILKPGANRVVVTVAYDHRFIGLEAMFLLGGFGVKMCRGRSVLTRLPQKLATGDWVNQGLPNYSGNLAYSTDFPFEGPGAIALRLPEFGGAAVRVKVNGELAGVAAWPPFEVEIGAKLRAGVNRLTLEILGCRRNSHGPFYHGELYIPWTGPAEMKSFERRERLLMPGGLLAAPQILQR